jgi:hypothetical protein
VAAAAISGGYRTFRVVGRSRPCNFHEGEMRQLSGRFLETTVG